MRFIVLIALVLAACSHKAPAAAPSDISLPSDATPAASDVTASAK